MENRLYDYPISKVPLLSHKYSCLSFKKLVNNKNLFWFFELKPKRMKIKIVSVLLVVVNKEELSAYTKLEENQYGKSGLQFFPWSTKSNQENFSRKALGTQQRKPSFPSGACFSRASPIE